MDTGHLVSSDLRSRPWRTRGSFNPTLNTNGLPTVNDITIGISEPLVYYDSFIVADPGTTVGTVGPTTSVKRGDRLIFTGGDAAVGANWLVVQESLTTFSAGQAPDGAVTDMGVRVIGAKHPAFMM